MKKSTVFLLILIAFLFVSLLFSLYFNFNKSPTALVPTPTPGIIPTETIDSTANWKTYTNTKYGFSFKYPSTWEFKSISKDNFSVFWIPNEYGPYVMTLKIDDSLGRTIDEYIVRDQFPYEILKKLNNGLIVSDPITEGSSVTIAFIKDRNKMFTFMISSGPPKIDQDPVDLLEQILSTFKFTGSYTSSAQELLDKLNQKLNANLVYKDEVIEGKVIKTLDLSDYYNLEFSKNGGKLNIIKQTLTDFGLAYNPKLDTSQMTLWGNSYQSDYLNCDLSGNEEFLWLRCY